MRGGEDGENTGERSPWSRRRAAPRAHTATIAAVHLIANLHTIKKGKGGERSGKMVVTRKNWDHTGGSSQVDRVLLRGHARAAARSHTEN